MKISVDYNIIIFGRQYIVKSQDKSDNVLMIISNSNY